MLPALLGAGAGMLSAQVLGVPEMAGQLIKVGMHLARRASTIDRDAAQEMVDGMRADVPVDKGLLFSGIGWSREGDEYEVSAKAVKPKKGGKDGADYAGFVERGTKAGARGHAAGADESYFTRDQWMDANPGSTSHPGRQFRSGRTLRRIHHQHPGTKAQPFFFPNVRAVMGKRWRQLVSSIGGAGADAGF